MTMTHDIPILYEDDHMVIIDKPSGLPVHAGPKGGDNIENMIQSWYSKAKRPPYLAHRLDRDTSGCLVLGKTKPALRKLNHVFAHRRAQKTYHAIVSGILEQNELTIQAKLAKRSDDPRSWWMEVNEETGQVAVTHVKKCDVINDRYTLVECTPKTGRTHQLRVHLAHIGHPILGDMIYRTKEEGGLMLHASSLSLPFDDDMINVISPIPKRFEEVSKR